MSYFNFRSKSAAGGFAASLIETLPIELVYEIVTYLRICDVRDLDRAFPIFNILNDRTFWIYVLTKRYMKAYMPLLSNKHPSTYKGWVLDKLSYIINYYKVSYIDSFFKLINIDARREYVINKIKNNKNWSLQ